MKKVYFIIQIVIILGVIGILIYGFSGFKNSEIESQRVFKNSQQKPNEISKLIAEKEKNSSFEKIRLFTRNENSSDKVKLNTFVKQSVLLKVNAEDLNNILRDRKENIEIQIPGFYDSDLNIILTRVSVLSKDFSLGSKNSSDEKKQNFDKGLAYRGIIKGNNSSWAAISIFNDFVMGLIADENGNYVLGSIKNDRNEYTSNYILYNDKDLLGSNNFKCGVGDMEDKFVRNTKSVTLRNNIDGITSIDTVGIYFEADYQMYVDNNRNPNLLANFITGIFNQVAVIYQNEQLPINISAIKYWTNQDPYYNDTASYDILQKFGYQNKDNFQGDLAHLLSTGHGQILGGIAWINVLCTQYNSADYSGRFAFSNIENNFNPYPTYSWTVTVVAHEMGHNFGSYHTHACHWPNGAGIGPIDTCVVTSENSSFFDGCVPIYPSNSCVRPRMGTLMSYCHFCTQYGGGINLSYGFGQMPGDTVRLWYQRASCLHYETNSSENPVAYNLIQNYPNPFNPVTNIKYALPEDGYVTLTLYDVTGREVAKLIENKFFSSGIYSYVVDANIYNMSSGVYFYRINVTRDSKRVYSEIKKMVLIK